MTEQFKKEAISGDSAGLRFLYQTVIGRAVLSLLSARWLSALAGRVLDSPLSKPLTKKFIRRNGITSDEYKLDNLRCFNDCFARELQDGARPIDYSSEALISPCDGRLSVYRITEGLVLPIKQSQYSIDSLLCNKELSDRYRNGICLVFRLCVENYHRYCYIDNGRKGDNSFISGRLHTVRPIALQKYPVFCENCREYTVMETENLGFVTQIEVGAMLVGKIKNHHASHTFSRGEEKGLFLYGGSTIVLLIEAGKAEIPNELFEATDNGYEVLVKMGQRIGSSKKASKSYTPL